MGDEAAVKISHSRFHGFAFARLLAALKRPAFWNATKPGSAYSRRLILKYLVGELYRRIGESELARNDFDEVIAEASGSQIPNADAIRRLAIQQRDAPEKMMD